MEYRRLPLSCQCGVVPKRISGVGLSSAHELVIEWRCPLCRRNVAIVKALSDCWRDCFIEESSKTPKPSNYAMTETPDDRKFLQSVGISCSEYADVPFSLDALASKLRDVLMRRPQIVR
jgi:hypothetical protein